MPDVRSSLSKQWKCCRVVTFLCSTYHFTDGTHHWSFIQFNYFFMKLIPLVYSIKPHLIHLNPWSSLFTDTLTIWFTDTLTNLILRVLEPKVDYQSALDSFKNSIISFLFFFFPPLICFSNQDKCLQYFGLFLSWALCLGENFLCTPVGFFLLPLLYFFNSHVPLKSPYEEEMNTWHLHDLLSRFRGLMRAWTNCIHVSYPLTSLLYTGLTFTSLPLLIQSLCSYLP